MILYLHHLLAASDSEPETASFVFLPRMAVLAAAAADGIVASGAE
jgi:hypothetical protein